MPISQAKELGKDKAVYIPTDIPHYKEASDRIMEILRTYTEKFEQRSIDEAYLDVSDLGSFEEARVVAEQIKKDVSEKEGITCSVGIGPNKLIAKMAGKVKKPDGLTLIKSEEVKGFLNPLPVSKLFGIGPKSLEFFETVGIKTIEDLSKTDVSILTKQFGEKKGKEFWERANGIDTDEVEELEKQQISKIGTLKENTKDLDLISKKVDELAEELQKKIQKEGIKFKTVSVIIILTNLETHTKSKTLDNFTDDVDIVQIETKKLFQEFLEKNPDKKLRRCGVRVSGFDIEQKEDKKQKSLFSFGK